MLEVVLCVFLFFCSIKQFSHAQIATITELGPGSVGFFSMIQATTDNILSSTGLNQAIHYGQTLAEWALAAKRFEQQVQQWTREAEQYAKAIASFRDVSNFKEFMDAYSRVLTYELYEFTRIIVTVLYQSHK